MSHGAGFHCRKEGHCDRASRQAQNLLERATANRVVLVENRRQPSKYLVDKDFLDSLVKERESILATLEILADRELTDRLLTLSKTIDDDLPLAGCLPQQMFLANEQDRGRKPPSPRTPPRLRALRHHQKKKRKTRTPNLPLNFDTLWTPPPISKLSTVACAISSERFWRKSSPLPRDPEGEGERYGLPLRGSLAGYWKHQFGNHRVVYRIDPEHHVVVVCAVGVRKQGDAEDKYLQATRIRRQNGPSRRAARVRDKESIAAKK